MTCAASVTIDGTEYGCNRSDHAVMVAKDWHRHTAEQGFGIDIAEWRQTVPLPERAAPLAAARASLEAAGYVVLKAKSYRAAQERQRLALAQAEWAERDEAENRAWLERDVFPWERHLVQRLQHIAALAGSLGATAEQMVGPPCTCGMSGCAEPVKP